MQRTDVLEAFAALSHGARLDLLRVLVVAGPAGLAAGAIARHLDMSASRLSFHLSVLEQAGLVRSRRDGRSVIYAAAQDAIDGVVRYLMRDCCARRMPDHPHDRIPVAEDQELSGG